MTSLKCISQNKCNRNIHIPGSATLMFMSSLDLSGDLNKTCKKYSEACLEVCNELNIEAIDLWSAIQKREDWKDVCFIDDGVHFSAEGNKIVSKEILKVLKEAEWEPSLYWKLMPVEFGEDSEYDPVDPDGISNINIPFPKNEDWE
ncbi:unnamed protein product [Trifolium pratense]|uniref:Uncharacterized protein n=1 Tax=Trifolium pratense TaxID=57577 RepID=A0ACB0LQL4_TRIPR|nr:unnamed protein product [Trifolium pratense]